MNSIFVPLDNKDADMKFKNGLRDLHVRNHIIKLVIFLLYKNLFIYQALLYTHIP